MSTVLVQGRSLYGRLKREIAENILSHSSEKNYRRLMATSNKIAKTEHQKAIAAWIDNRLVEGNPGGPFLTRLLKGLHPKVRKNYLANMIVSLFFRDQQRYDRYVGTGVCLGLEVDGSDGSPSGEDKGEKKSILRQAREGARLSA